MKLKPMKLKPPKLKPPKRSNTKYKEGLLDNDHGWISPKGEFIPCQYGEHDDIAEDYIMPKYNIDPGDIGVSGPKGLLERNSWIMIQNETIYHPGHTRMNDEWYVTAEQFQFINDYMSHHNKNDINYMDLRIK